MKIRSAEKSALPGPIISARVLISNPAATVETNHNPGSMRHRIAGRYCSDSPV